MKKISGWSLLGYIAGTVFALGSFIRYYVIYPDLDRAIVYTLMGLIICALAWLYNKQLQHGHELESIGDYLADKSN